MGEIFQSPVLVPYDPDAPWNKYWPKISKEFGIEPAEAKFLYIIGTVRHLMGAADKLYDGHSLPAFILAAGAVELIGRSCKGGVDVWGNGWLKEGFTYVFQILSNPERVVMPDSSREYTPEHLTYLRHFTAHGSATVIEDAKKYLEIDSTLVGWLWGAIGETLDRYHDDLDSDEDCQNKMVKAEIYPLFSDESREIHRVEPVLKLFRKEHSFYARMEGGEWAWKAKHEKIKDVN